jgi:class 3 adenylate cyclase
MRRIGRAGRREGRSVCSAGLAGDGKLMTVRAAMAEREAAEPEERRIRYRIGINIGDIVLEDGDIFGAASTSPPVWRR